jgi:segregation and condensation protein B
MIKMEKQAIIEGLLFVVGDDGLSLEQIQKIMEISEETAKKLIEQLTENYEQADRGLKISKLANNYKIVTKSEYKEYYKKLIEEEKNRDLSQAALEILAIIVYNEPVTRIQVEEIRGIGSSQMIRKLVIKGFLKECGRSNLPGRPILYQTTELFLDYFGLATKEELPKLEFQNQEELVDESELYNSSYKEE